MNVLLLILVSIFCSSEYLITQKGFFIVTDRKLKKLVTKDEMHADLITLVDDNEGSLGFDYLWDRYFPKLFMYGFSCEGLSNLKTSISLNLEAITINDEVLFNLTFVYNFKNIILSNFVDSNNILISNALFSEEKDQNNIFILSREAKNVNNLRASFKYLTCTEKLVPLYRKLIKNLFQYIKNIKDLEENVINTESTNVYKKVSDAKNDMISIATKVIENFSSLRIPIVNKISKLFAVERFKDALRVIFRSLEDVVEVFLKNKDNREGKILGKSNVIDYINNVIIHNNSFFECIEIYTKIFIDLKSIENFTDDFICLGSINPDLEIISDCEVEKMIKFVKKYYSLLLGYCRIMKKCDFSIVFSYHYISSNSSEICLLRKKLEDFYIDKLIAQRIYSFIKDYEEEKSDLLIFLQTDYFEHNFSSRIVNNLKLIKIIYSNHNKNVLTQETSDDEMLFENNFCDYIINLENLWSHILKDDQSNRIKSFCELIYEHVSQSYTH